MINQLYDIFKEKWFNIWKVERIFIYSDPHLKGKGVSLDQDAVSMRKLFNYASDELQIANINRQVNKNDLFICLGDVGDQNQISKIKAKRKILIKGNHDVGNSNYTNFDEIYEGPLFINDKILLSHEPIFNDCWLNIHGHIHNQFELDKFKEEGRHFICVSANLHNYMPINLGDLFKHQREFKDFMSFSEIESIHRKTINRATERKRKRNLSEFSTQ